MIYKEQCKLECITTIYLYDMEYKALILFGMRAFIDKLGMNVLRDKLEGV